MNLPTIQIPYYFTDQRHSGYADAVMAGKVSSANFVFVSDVEDIAPILPEEPDLRLGSPEHFLGAFMAALAKPENLKALPHIIAFWQDRRLAPLSLLAEAYLGVGLQKYARDAQVPQQRTLYRQAVAKLKREIAKNASPVTPQALEFLCLWPDIAAQKLGLLVEGADYSPVLAKLGFTGTARNIAAFLLKTVLPAISVRLPVICCLFLKRCRKPPEKRRRKLPEKHRRKLPEKRRREPPITRCRRKSSPWAPQPKLRLPTAFPNWCAAGKISTAPITAICPGACTGFAPELPSTFS